MALTLSGIVIYPVKSLAGISVSTWPVTKTGLQYDRKWMLIDNDGRFLSQRTLPRMALVKTAIRNQELVLSAPEMDELSLALEPSQGEIADCIIWDDQYAVWQVSKPADQWFSEFLNHPCRLVYHPETATRQVDQLYALPADQTAFSDGFPFLLVSENSLVELNQAMNLEMSMERFRPNLIVSGCAGYAEDSWREISISGIGFRLPKPCSRCAIPTIDPETAKTGKEPLTTLNRTRKWQHKVYFGQNAIHDQCGQLSIGDAVQIYQLGEKQPPL